MNIRPSEITDILKREIREYGREIDVAETGTVLSIGDGIARVFGLQAVMTSELVEFPGGVRGMVLNLEEDNVGVAVMGEASHVREGDLVRRTGRIIEVPSRRGAARPRGRRPRQADRRQGPDRDHGDPSRRDQGAGHRGAQGRAPAAPDRPQGDRRDDADRPRPARADHRRPPDRQDRDRPRHDHQPEGRRRRLHLRRHRAEAVDRRPGGRQAEAARRHGVHDRRGGDGQRAGAAPVHLALHRLHDGRVVPRQRQARADRVRRPLEAGGRLPAALAAAAPAAGPRGVSRATSSTSTRACWSAPRSSPTSSAAAA